MQRQCRPGERIVAGQVLVFDLAALNDHLAREDFKNCPADLSGVSDDELTRLAYAATRYYWCERDNSFAERIAAERARRGQDSMGRRLATVA